MGRYAHDLRVFGPALAAQRWHGRGRRGDGRLVVVPAEDGSGATVVDLSGLPHLDNRTAATVAAVRGASALDGVATTVVGASGALAADAGKLGLGELLDGGR